MKHSYLSFIFFMLLFLVIDVEICNAQDISKIDSLEQELRFANDTLKIDILLNLCWSMRDNEIQKSIDYGLQAMTLATEYNDFKSLANAHSFVGVAYRNLGNYTKAIDFYLKGLMLAQKHLLVTQEGYAYINIGNLYMYQKNYYDALTYFNKAVRISEKNKNKSMLAYCNLNIGRVFLLEEKYHQALKYISKALELRVKTGDTQGQSTCYKYIGDVYFGLKKYSLAIKNYDSTISITKNNINGDMTSSIYNNISKIHLLKSDIENAELYAQKSLKIAVEINAKLRMKNAYITLVEINKRAKNYKVIAEYQNYIIKYNDSLFNQKLIDKIRHIEYINKQYEYNKEFKKQEFEYKEEINRQKQIKYYSIFIIVILVSITLMFYIFARNKRKANKVLIDKNKQIKGQKAKLEHIYSELSTTNTEIVEVNEKLKVAKQEADTANRLKSEFLANMSHEIRTPMNAVLGFSEILKTKLIDKPEYKSLIVGIIKGGNSLITLINDILDLSKIEAGRLEIIPAPINLLGQIQDMKQIFSEKSKSKDLQFLLEIDPRLPEVLMLDQTRMRQILFNLVGNAVKFTENGSVSISVKIEGDVQIGNKIDLYLAIKDTGIGIAQNQTELIFEAFLQTKGQAAKYGGTGLGLAITKRLIEAMNGIVSVESKVGKGSTFYIQFKNVIVPNAKALVLESGLVENICFSKPKILVVDDIKPNRDVVILQLEAYNCEVFEAESGQEAINFIQKTTVDLILMDIQMPVLDGYETTKQIKNTEKYRKIPIIALTAMAMKEQEGRYSAVFNAYLKKPITGNDLIGCLMKFLPYTKREEVNVETKHKTVDYAKELELHIEKIGKLPDEFIEIYKTEILPMYEDVIDIMDINFSKEFALKLVDIGTKFGIEPFVKFGTELEAVTKKFQLSKMELLLNEFTKIAVNSKK